MAKAAKQDDLQVGIILQLDPKVILADDNSRFALKETRIESLAKSILETGGIMEPVEVEPLTSTDNGYKYKLTTGFYRVAAVTKLNTEQNAGLTIPAIVHPSSNPQERLTRQLMENMERENQSPMDQAIAIKKLMDNGYSRMQIRELFSRPGGRKGLKNQPASNSFVNMTLSFLDLDDSVQKKIHEGTIGVSAAYELTRVDDKNKRKAILARAEAERLSVIEREEKEDKKITEAQVKVELAEKEATEAKTALDEALAKEGMAQQSVDALIDKAKETYELTLHGDPAARKEAKKAHQSVEVERSDAVAAYEKARKEREAIQKRQEAANNLAAQKAEKLREIREGAKAKAGTKTAKTAVSGADIKKAAAIEGEGQYVALTLKEIREVMKDVCFKGPGANPIVSAFGQALMDCFDGKTAYPDELYKVLVGVVTKKK